MPGDTGSAVAARPSLGGPRLRRFLQPAQGGLSEGDYFELRLLTVGSLALSAMGLLTTLAFLLLFGFNPIDFLVTGGATVVMATAYAFAVRGHRRTSSWLLIGALTTGVWIVMLRNPSGPTHNVYILANLIPVLLALTLRRILVGVGLTLAALLYIVYHVATLHHTLGDLSVAVLLVAGAFVAGLGPVLRERDRRHAHQAEQQRRAVQADYRALFDNMTEGFAHCRMIFEDGLPTDWEYLRVNPAFGPLTGLDDATGKRVSQLIPGLREADPALFERYARVAKGGGPEQFEVDVAALDRWFAVSAYAAGPDEFVAVFDNITQRKRAEQRLRQSEQMLEAAQRLAKVGGWRYDPRTQRMTATSEVARIYEGEPEILDGAEPSQFISHFVEGDRERMAAAFKGAVEEGTPYDLELQLVTAKGNRRVVRTIGQAEMQSGMVTEVFGSIIDITDQRRAEQEREHRTRQAAEVKRLQELNQMRMEFLNTAAHDLKTPLTPLKLEMATLRLRGKLDAQQTESLALMDRNVNRFQVLVDDMLDAARLQSGRLKLRRESVVLGPLVQEAVASFKESAGQADLALDLEALPDVQIDADPSKAMQVLMNLVSNAVKYTPAGGRVSIRVEAHPKEAVVSVQDSGLGMTAEQLGRLFQPFVRLHEALPGTAKGTGLGLYICKGIIEQHGGRIWAESEGPGKGSTFHVAWPLAAPGDGQPVAPASA